jgi:hypothetical protein
MIEEVGHLTTHDELKTKRSSQDSTGYWITNKTRHAELI